MISGDIYGMSSACDDLPPRSGLPAGSLSKSCVKAKDTEHELAIEAAILASASVATSVAQRYVHRGVRGVRREDLEQVAYLALLKAARRFDGTCAEDFVLYAVGTILTDLRSWFRNRALAGS